MDLEMGGEKGDGDSDRNEDLFATPVAHTEASALVAAAVATAVTGVCRVPTGTPTASATALSTVSSAIAEALRKVPASRAGMPPIERAPRLGGSGGDEGGVPSAETGTDEVAPGGFVVEIVEADEGDEDEEDGVLIELEIETGVGESVVLRILEEEKGEISEVVDRFAKANPEALDATAVAQLKLDLEAHASEARSEGP